MSAAKALQDQRKMVNALNLDGEGAPNPKKAKKAGEDKAWRSVVKSFWPKEKASNVFFFVLDLLPVAFVLVP